VGAALQAGTAPRSKENTKGHVRGYDVRTGRRLWVFHTIPHPGEFGNETWLTGVHQPPPTQAHSPARSASL